LPDDLHNVPGLRTGLPVIPERRYSQVFDIRNKKVVMIGAGPAGLTAAYELCKAGVKSIVLEKDQVVGGIARTVDYKGFHFDIGGHRFFTKVQAVDNMWREVLAEDDFLHCRRMSRIFYNKKFFHYPLRAFDALFGLGIWNSSLILLSYINAQVFPDKTEETFEQWVSNRFGKRLYRVFFKTYTEKVWGIPCTELTAEWAAQRIKGLSLITALKNALIKQKVTRKDDVIKTLIDAFDYPRLGPGMMWKAVASVIQQRGSKLRMGAGVERVLWHEDRVVAVEIRNGDGKELVRGSDFISTMPIRELIQKLDPPVPAEVLQRALSLNYRDFLTVALVVNKAEVFPDNWIYIHDPDVKMGRIQNFKNWSPCMVPDPEKTCLGLEYFCFEGDGLWTMSDQDLIDLGRQELAQIGMVKPEDIVDGAVVRMPKAYPVYDSTYAESLQLVREFLGKLVNLQLVGRNGMHKYNNQDHSMLTAMLAVKNILGASNDLWQVNAEQEYHEEVTSNGDRNVDDLVLLASTQPHVPERRSIQSVR
jgi:protoporphyrinogen oxidase